MAIGIGRRQFISALGGATVAWPLVARAQQSDRMRLIGVVMGSLKTDAAGQSRLATFRDALAKLGWMEGRNLRVEVFWGGADPALFTRYAADLVALRPEVILTDSSPSLDALRQQTHTIPIVFVSLADPVGQGFVASLAHPGGNITGFSGFDSPMAGKWLEMLTRLTPPVAHTVVLLNSCDHAIRGSIASRHRGSGSAFRRDGASSRMMPRSRRR